VARGAVVVFSWS